jgi:hypothetical protein
MRLCVPREDACRKSRVRMLRSTQDERCARFASQRVMQVCAHLISLCLSDRHKRHRAPRRSAAALARASPATMRKKVDQRIRTLVENSVKLHQRSMFVIVGDRGRDQARLPPLRRRICAARSASACNSAGGAAARASGALGARYAARVAEPPGACVRPHRW